MSAVDFLRKMTYSKVQNYVIPGLSSALIAQKEEEGGCVRLFECSREHQENITPHSHRFDLLCQVLRGTVRNILWCKATEDHPTADTFVTSKLHYGGGMGKYSVHTIGPGRYVQSSACTYEAGEWYAMDAEDIHSIEFSKDAVVLFFEGPQVVDSTYILEPFVDGERIPTFKVEPWMFKPA